MAKIKKFDRPALRQFRLDFEKATEAFAKKHGVVLQLGDARFGSTDATYKLKVVIAPNASGMSAQEVMGRKSLELEGHFFGLKPEDYGRTFVNWDHDTYRLTGVKSSRPKYPLSAENTRTGKGFKFGTDVIDKLSKVKK
jgi:hypothetical protein